MNTILGELGKNSKFIELLKNVENKQSPIVISGLNDVGMIQLGTAINEFGKKPICILTYNEIQAKKIYEDIKYFTDKVVLFPKKEVVTYDYIAESKDIPYKRIEALNKIATKKNLVVITTIEAATQKLPQKDVLYRNKLHFKTGESYNLEELKQKLVSLGYSRYDLIEGRGQFSVRGGIVDIATNEKVGIRIEFWGDDIDSIREFNIETQRSIKNIETATIYPAHEYILDEPAEKTCKKIKEKYKSSNIIEEDIEQIKTGNYISKIDKYFDCFYEKQETILDYLNKDYVVFLDEINKIETRSTNIKEDRKNLERSLIEKERQIPEAITNILEFEQIQEILDKKQVIYIQKQDTQIKVQGEKYNFNYRTVNYYKSETTTFIEDLKKAVKEKKTIYILTENKEKAKKIKSMLEEQEIICKIEEKLDQTIIVKSRENIVTISIGKISTGFENYDLNQLVISADDLINGEKKK